MLPEELRLAEELVPLRPDSALVVLNNTEYAGAKNDYVRASYCLIKTYAEYNAYAPGIDQAQMREGVDYFLLHGNRDRKALAYYLRAVVSEVNGSGDEAGKASDLLRACRLVKGSSDHRLAALVNHRYAALLDERKWYESSLPYLETSLREARLAGSVPLQVTSLINMSYRSLFLSDGSGDYTDAIGLSEKALEVAGDSDPDVARALNALSACYSRDGQFDRALDCARRSVKIQERLVREGKRKEEVHYVALGDAFRKMSMADSALYYAGKAMESTVIVTRMSGTQLSYIVYRDLLHDSENAVKYLTRYNALREQQADSQQNDKVITERMEIEKSYIRSSRTRVICISLAAVAVLCILLYLLCRKLAKRKSDLQRKNREIEIGQAQLRESESDRSSLRSSLMYRDKLVLSLFDHPHYLSDGEFERLEHILNDACDNFTERMKSDFPGMTRAELRIAVLLRFGFSIRQISVMLGISPTSVTKGKQRLKARVSSCIKSESGLEDFIAHY